MRRPEFANTVLKEQSRVPGKDPKNEVAKWTISGILLHICLFADAGESDRFPGPQRSYHPIPNRHLGQDSSFQVLVVPLQPFTVT